MADGEEKKKKMKLFRGREKERDIGQRGWCEEMDDLVLSFWGVPPLYWRPAGGQLLSGATVCRIRHTHRTLNWT